MSRILRCPACEKVTMFRTVDSAIYGREALQCSACRTTVETAQATLGQVSDSEQ